MAVMPVLTTSKVVPGYVSLSMTSRMRPKLKAGLGSPRAADAPRTMMRYVPAGLGFRTISGTGERARSGPKKRQLKEGLERSSWSAAPRTK
jgi:hypothetical protein